MADHSHKDINIQSSILAVNFLLFVSSLVTVLPITFISIYMLSRYWAAFTFLPFLIPKKHFSQLHVLPVFSRVTFTAFGIGPLLTYLMLYCNFFFAANDNQIVKEIVSIEKQQTSTLVTFKDDSFYTEPWLRSFNTFPLGSKNQKWYGYYHTKTGIFGFDILLEKQIIAED